MGERGNERGENQDVLAQRARLLVIGIASAGLLSLSPHMYSARCACSEGRNLSMFFGWTTGLLRFIRLEFPVLSARLRAQFAPRGQRVTILLFRIIICIEPIFIES